MAINHNNWVSRCILPPSISNADTGPSSVFLSKQISFSALNSGDCIAFISQFWINAPIIMIDYILYRRGGEWLPPSPRTLRENVGVNICSASKQMTSPHNNALHNNALPMLSNTKDIHTALGNSRNKRGQWYVKGAPSLGRLQWLVTLRTLRNRSAASTPVVSSRLH